MEVAVCTGVKELLEARAQGSKGFNSERGDCCTNERGCMLVFMSFLGFFVECKVKRMGHRGGNAGGEWREGMGNCYIG